MPFALVVTAKMMYVPAGSGGAGLAQQQANIPGYGSGLTAGQYGNAQSMDGIQGEMVIAVLPEAPTATEFRAAITAAATDLNSNFVTTANVATWQGWPTGNP